MLLTAVASLVVPVALSGCVPVGDAGTPAAAAGPAGTGSPGTAGPATGSGGGPGAGPMMARQAAPAQPSTEDRPSRITYPANGDNRWRLAGRRSGVAGGSGTLLRLRVAVEDGIAGLDADRFAGRVFRILADPRGWTATGQWRLRLVAAGDPYDVTIYLATPGTRDLLCADGVDRYTSCRRGDMVVLNVARWAYGVPGYPAGLETYRDYMVDHEVGHRLGHGHELCPGPGRPAPLMQQQTLGLHGCLPNAWPVVDGQPYAGPSGRYDDVPPAGG